MYQMVLYIYINHLYTNDFQNYIKSIYYKLYYFTLKHILFHLIYFDFQKLSINIHIILIYLLFY